MSVKAIRYMEEHRDWCFPTENVTTEELGRRIATSLESGTEQVQFKGGFAVTVNYVTEMLRFKAKHGWFYDSTDLKTGDHTFDHNRITPGANWGKVKRMKAEVRELNRQVTVARLANQDRDADEMLERVRALGDAIRSELERK
jgi:hypothetical protein